MNRLAYKYPSVDASGILYSLTADCKVFEPKENKRPVCEDTDDKFLAAALGENSRTIISGDKHLLDVNGYSGIEVLSPAEFIEKYLSEQAECSRTA